MADRTLAERARELADSFLDSPFSGSVIGIAIGISELLTALADENDTLGAHLAQLDLVAAGTIDKLMAAEAERDRYWNLAEQLGEVIEQVTADDSDWLEYPFFYDGLMKFRAEKGSRDV